MNTFTEKQLKFWGKTLFAVSVSVVLYTGCYTREEVILRKIPKQVSRWSDEELCNFAWSPNPAIKAELLKRNLFNLQEYNYIIEGDHGYYPTVGMRKCAMWTCSNGSKLLSKSTLSNGTVCEIWKVHIGEYVFSKALGGYFLLITIEDDRDS